MAKQGFTENTVTPVLQHRAADRGWALCVGAGTSSGLFPDWGGLVQRLIDLADPAGVSAASLSQSLLDRFSADALIQAAHHQLGMMDEEFAEALTTCLYQDVRARMREDEWNTFTRALAGAHLNSVSRKRWTAFDALIAKYFTGTTAVELSGAVIDAIEAGIGPSVILSFNAEPLFLTLLNSEVVKRRWPASARGAPPPDVFDRVTNSISMRRPSRVPFVFCHGLLPVPNRGVYGRGSNKLVFSESAYLALANSAFSWQSAVFLETAMTKSIVFVGVSLADPNMRRWLSWVHTNRGSEIATFNDAPAGPSTPHYWISRAPRTAAERRWIEASVAHLGVRLVWIQRYAQIPDVLAKMVGTAS